MYSYCLFCVTQKRDEVAQRLRLQYGLNVICPKIIHRKWVKGTALEESREYLPGYLFFYTDTPMENPRALQREQFVMRCLGAPDVDYQLQGSDLAFAEMLYDKGGTLGILKAYKEGDRVRLAESALGHFEGEIIKLQRAKGRALVQYTFDGVVYKTWVGFDMIEDPVEIPKPEEKPRE